METILAVKDAEAVNHFVWALKGCGMRAPAARASGQWSKPQDVSLPNMASVTASLPNIRTRLRIGELDDQ